MNIQKNTPMAEMMAGEISRLSEINARLVEALELHTGHVWAWSRRLLEPDAGKHAHEQGKMLRDDLRGTRALLAEIAHTHVSPAAVQARGGG